MCMCIHSMYFIYIHTHRALKFKLQASGSHLHIIITRRAFKTSLSPRLYPRLVTLEFLVTGPNHPHFKVPTTNGVKASSFVSLPASGCVTSPSAFLASSGFVPETLEPLWRGRSPPEEPGYKSTPGNSGKQGRVPRAVTQKPDKRLRARAESSSRLKERD